MKLTLRRLREQKRWTLDVASKLFHISRNKLKDYEEYREVPPIEDLTLMLKMYGFYYDEIIWVIYEDINRKYKGVKYDRKYR